MSNITLKERILRARDESAVLTKSRSHPLSHDDQLRLAYLAGGFEFLRAAAAATPEELAEVERLLSKKESA